MSEFEQTVEYVFAESGVHPMKLSELIDTKEKQQTLLDTELNYPEVNGEKALRKSIADLYGEKDLDKVLVTVGASESNYILAQCLLEPGDHVAILQPTYRQFWGAAKNLGAEISSFKLVEERQWELDIRSLDEAVGPKTKVIALVNPNNPTGRALSEPEVAAIVSAARKCGAWLIADEVYAGAERQGDEETPSFYGRYEKCISVGSLSKAYGLPGLRLGWAIGPKEIIDKAWRHHEYVTISSTMLSNRLAREALSRETRPRILARTRKYIREGWPLVLEMVSKHCELLSVVPPDASAMCFLKYNVDIDSISLAKRLAKEKSILVVPGAYFGQESHIRFSFALPHKMLKEGLDRLIALLLEIRN